ncbi:MAG: alpha/beta hydrolase [Deltaproteobacteria bacterium]|nr:alpha/beta hydrolase [Deltaproteobacteria bacterium]
MVPPLARGFRCIVPDLPLGSHTPAMRADADLSPPALARLIAEFLAAPELRSVTLVGNDTGGALCQLVATRYPERIGRMILTSCDAFDNFPPKFFAPLAVAARSRALPWTIVQAMRAPLLARAPLAYGWLAKRPLDEELLRSFTRPAIESAAVRRDLAKVIAGLDPRLTIDAAERLHAFTAPTLLAWATEDRSFPLAHAHRLADILPDARVAEIDDAWTFAPEDSPDRLVELITGFLRERPSLSA